MYNNTLKVTTASDLLGVLMVADKFEVASCMRYCSELLLKMEMSLESALSYLELPSSVSVAQVVQSLVDSANKYLVALYTNFSKSQEEAMTLPLCAIEVVLGSDDLKVDSEDDVYDFVLKWTKAHYPKPKECQEILKKLARLIRFRYMSKQKLEEALTSPDFEHDKVCKLAFASANCDENRLRVYKFRPIKVVQYEFSCPRGVVYFDLSKELLFQSREYSYFERFCLGGLTFWLFPDCSLDHFALVLLMKLSSETSWQTTTSNCEFAVMKKPSEEFQIMHKHNNYPLEKVGVTDKVFSLAVIAASIDLFGIPWTDFMADDSEYFIDDILHLRVELTINNSQA